MSTHRHSDGMRGVGMAGIVLLVLFSLGSPLLAWFVIDGISAIVIECSSIFASEDDELLDDAFDRDNEEKLNEGERAGEDWWIIPVVAFAIALPVVLAVRANGIEAGPMASERGPPSSGGRTT